MGIFKNFFSALANNSNDSEIVEGELAQFLLTNSDSVKRVTNLEKRLEEGIKVKTNLEKSVSPNKSSKEKPAIKQKTISKEHGER